jgi:uncharacterized protein YdhG (YjbR/CyaY superfamily)
MAGPHFKTVEEYISSFPEDIQIKLKEVRDAIQEAIAEGEPAISYNIAAFKVDGKVVVFFAGFKNHISMYPFGDIPELRDEVKEYYTSGKGTIQFPLDAPLPIPLIKKIAKYKLKEFKEKEESKK